MFDVIFTRSGSLDTGYRVLGHFQGGKINQGRHHKDYLDKSEISLTRTPERRSHQILLNVKSFYKIHTYKVPE